MPSQLHKVQKHIIKKKGSTKTKSLHENSRDARRLRRADNRDDRVSRVENLKQKANVRIIARVEFFQSALPAKDEDQPSEPVDDATVHTLVTSYLSRDQEEVDDLKAERRAGRPPSTRQTNLEQAIAAENKEYESGFWMPDLRDGKNIDALREWSGKWDAMGLIRFVRVFSSGKVEASAWPPRGAV